MGRRNSNRKICALLESDDENISVTLASDHVETEFNNDALLDKALDDLYEKRGSMREKALSSIIHAFSNNLDYEFLEKKFATLLDRCLNSIKKGSSKEVSLACHVIGVLALTVGDGENAKVIFDASVTPISQALNSGLEFSKIVSLVECLAIITFVGAEPEKTEKSMQIMWQQIHPKLVSNVVAAKLPSHTITAVVTAWSFLLSTMEGVTLNPKYWQESLSYLSGLLDKDDRSVRIAAGEALALIFEMGSLEKFSKELGKSKELVHVQGLKGKVINQMEGLSVEAGGKGSAKKDLNSQRNLFKDILEFLEHGYCPETSFNFGGNSLYTSTWSQRIQLNFLRQFLRGGFIYHMMENEFLHGVFDFTPKRKVRSERPKSHAEKRMFKSPNSGRSKARTQQLNKERMQKLGIAV